MALLTDLFYVIICQFLFSFPYSLSTDMLKNNFGVLFGADTITLHAHIGEMISLYRVSGLSMSS